MNITEMHIAVNHGVDKIHAFQADTILNEEIDLELNKAQESFIKTRYNSMGNRYGKGFEQSQKRIDDIRLLVVEEVLDACFRGQVYPGFFVDFVTLPTSEVYMFLVNHRSLVRHRNCTPLVANVDWEMTGACDKREMLSQFTQVIAKNKYSQHDDIYTLLEDPFNTTKHSAPLTTIREDFIEVYTDDTFIVDRVSILYIRRPVEVSITTLTDCELPIHTHREIVEMAVDSILEGISDPRYRTHQMETLKSE